MRGPTGTVAVTGATGFVGRAALERLLSAGHEVRALARTPQAPRPGVKWIEGALDRPDSLAWLVEDADVVLHIAGVVNAPDAAGFHAANVAGTGHLVDAAKAAGVNRFVHVSSLAAREPGLSDYGDSKFRGEKIVATSLMDWTIVRPPAVYGPGDMEMFEMFRLARQGIVPVPAKGRFSVIHVDDLARLLVALLPSHEELTAGLFEPDDGRDEGWAHRDFARALGAAFGKRPLVLPMPARIMALAAKVDVAVRRKKAKLTPDRARYFSHPDWTVAALRKPPEELWRPQIATHQGLKDTARWYEQRGWFTRKRATE